MSKVTSSRARLGDKAKARAMYVMGISPDEIASILSLPSSESVTNWARKDNWQIERTKQLDVITSSLIQQLLDKDKAVLGDLQTIQEKAISSIKAKSGKGGVTPQKFSEATNSYIAAHDAIKKIENSAIVSSVLNDVLQIILEEVTDRTTLSRMGEKFRKVFTKYSDNRIFTRTDEE